MQKPMQRSLGLLVFSLLTSGIILMGLAQAQTPAASSPQTQQTSSDTQSPDKQSSTAPAKKPSATSPSATTLTLKTAREKHSYALGMNIGQSLAKEQLPVDPAIVARGLRDALAGKTAMTADEMKAALQELRGEVDKQMETKAHAAGEPNRKAGAAFLAANKTKEGVKVLPDGLQYRILKDGNGPKPTANDTVTVSYRGTLIDGKEFDNSANHGGSVSFPVQRVIQGWTEALQMMPVGSKWELYIPPDLAYGDRGSGPAIGPGETLIFEVELLSIGEQKK